MGTRQVRETENKHARTIWKQVEREVKRSELDTIASICGTTRETTGGVAKHATLTNEYDDGAERTGVPDNGFEHTTTTGDSSAV